LSDLKAQVKVMPKQLNGGYCIVCAGGWAVSYHLCGFSAGYGELQIGILLPVAKEEGKLREKAIVVGANSGDSLGV
jgi:hypothetical protein